MKRFKVVGLFMIAIVLLAGCVKNMSDSAEGKMTVTSYELNEHEQLLIDKSGGNWVSFFKLNGRLAEGEDLQYAVEVYKDGKYHEVLGETWGALESEYKDDMISFAVKDMNQDKNNLLELIVGSTSGTMTFNYELDVMGASFGNLIGNKVSLEKNTPAYLAAWTGSTTGSLRTISSEKGELPENLEDVEYALLFKILWTDEKEN